MTIHITPELEFSYVSFESNIPEASYAEVIARVLDTFKPGKFVVTIFANKESIAADTPRELEQVDYLNFEGEWLRNDVQYCRFKNYDLTCAFYSKFPSWWFTGGPSALPITEVADGAQKYSLIPTKKSLNRQNQTLIDTSTKITKDSTVSLLQQGTALITQTKLLDFHLDNNLDKVIQPKIKLINMISTSIAEEKRSKRSASSPQLFIKPITRAKVYRKASLVSNELTTEQLARPINSTRINNSLITQEKRLRSLKKNGGVNKLMTNDKSNSISELAGKVEYNMENVHITCNPLSKPYPYSTSCQNKLPINNNTSDNQQDEPKSSLGTVCGSFLPILALIPQTVVSLQYLSPKIKFTWWRNKISWNHA